MLPPELKKAFGSFSEDEKSWINALDADAERYVATHLARALLRALFADKDKQWRLADVKAERWQTSIKSPPLSSTSTSASTAAKSIGDVNVINIDRIRALARAFPVL